MSERSEDTLRLYIKCVKNRDGVPLEPFIVEWDEDLYEFKMVVPPTAGLEP